VTERHDTSPAEYTPEQSGTLQPALRFRGVGKRFRDGTVALTDVDVDVSSGEFVSVVGPSGCGKSTLLRITSGLSTATEGSVEVRAAKVGYVFQDATLLPWRSVRKNVELLAELERMPKAERRQRSAEAIKLVGLNGFERHRPRALSGGMRMRVSLARSLVLQPDLFLFDEPFGAVDEISRERLNDELLQLVLARRFAALFVTHSVSEAVFLSTRVIVMSPRPGRVLGDFPIPFDYPRLPQLRFSDEFAHVAARVSRCLRDAEV
jgi:NitT/TauT family transport system ATP-binding protein